MDWGLGPRSSRAPQPARVKRARIMSAPLTRWPLRVSVPRASPASRQTCQWTRARPAHATPICGHQASRIQLSAMCRQRLTGRALDTNRVAWSCQALPSMSRSTTVFGVVGTCFTKSWFATFTADVACAADAFPVPTPLAAPGVFVRKSLPRARYGRGSAPLHGHHHRQ